MVFVPHFRGIMRCMSELGDVLERLFCEPDWSGTVYAVVLEWKAPGELGQTATSRGRERQKESAVPTSSFSVNPPPVIEVRRPNVAEPPPDRVLELWIDNPGRGRAERSWMNEGGAERLATTWVGTGKAHSHTDKISFDLMRSVACPQGGVWPAPSTTDSERIFDHGWLREVLASLQIEQTGTGMLAERPVVLVRARLRPGMTLWPHWLPFGADEYRFAIDEEFVSLLSITGIVDESEFEWIEVQKVSYGLELSEDTFALPSTGQ
jgi:hypothetical protein